MASFWIRPEYVVDYRPILDAPVDAAGEVYVVLLLMYSSISYKCDNCGACGVILFVVAHDLKPSIFEVISENY